MLSRNDIRRALAKGNLKIFPFEPKNLTGIGYNLSTTDFAFSVNQGILLTIHEKATSHGRERYVIIPGNDVALFFSKEYIEVDSTLAGTFHSKVSRVSEGLGHISTTLDATWKGQLLLSVNNPTSKPVKFDLDSSGNIATLLLHKLDTTVTGSNIHDNNQGRCELLLAHFSEPLSNQKYRKKHLQLRAFVENELADSLNGFDSFLFEDYPPDRYSLQIKKLKLLLDRLKTDKLLIQEGRYILGENGNYLYLKNAEEQRVIKECALFDLKTQFDLLPDSFEEQGIDKAHLPQALRTIDEYIDIIDYELRMIDHIRRIKWHNQQVCQFASEDSELVRERKKAERKQIRIMFWLPLFILITILALIAFTLAKVKNTETVLLFITACAAVLVPIIQWWYHSVHKEK